METMRQGIEWIAENPAIATAGGTILSLLLGSILYSYKSKHTAKSVGRQIVDNIENELKREEQEAIDMCVERMGNIGGLRGLALMVQYNKAKEAGEEWTKEYRNAPHFIKDVIEKADEMQRKYGWYDKALQEGPQGAD